MKIGIVGYGSVGKAMHKLFPNAIIYDKFIPEFNKKEEIKKAEVIFVCVPTNSKNDGSCDTSIVEEVIKEFNPSLFILRSTVEIGFTDFAVNKYNKEIVFNPEYFGETVSHPFSNLKNQDWISLGGKQKSINKAINVYQQVKNSNIRIYQAKAKDVEFAKYMENTFLALKVTFVNEMYDIANKMDVNYNQAREIWLGDPRIGTSHTFVYQDKRGFSGKCLSKDLNSFLYQAKNFNADATLLEAVKTKNKFYKDK